MGLRLRRRLRIVLALVAIAVAASALILYVENLGPHPKHIVCPQDLSSCYVYVFAGSFQSYHFSLSSATNGHVTGNFFGTGGDGKIYVFITNDTYYQSYVKAGTIPPPSPNYDSGPVVSGSFDVILPGTTTYWIVYYDPFNSWRNVTTSVNLVTS